MGLQRIWGLSRRWYWLLLVGCVLAGGTSLLLSRSLPVTYQATVKLLVTPASSALLLDIGTLTTAERLARTYADVMKTTAVVDRAREIMPPELRSASATAIVDTRSTRETGFFQVSVEHSDPRVAAELANAIAQAFIQRTGATQQARFQGPLQNLRQRIDEVASDINQRAGALERLRRQLPETRAPGTNAQTDIDRLTRQVSDLEQTYALLLRSYEDVRVAEAKDVNTVGVVEPALLPTAPVRPNIAVNTIVAASLGLLVTLGIIVLVEYADDSVSTPERLGRAVALPTLAVVGELSAATSQADAYQILRTNLQHMRSGQRLRTMLVTSSDAGEGKTTTATNLAFALALAGFETLIVDADLRRPTLHSYFDIHNNWGLMTLANENADIANCIQETRTACLRVLTSGPIPQNAAAVLGSKRMSERLAELSRAAEYVIVDSPPILATPHALTLAPRVDGVLLVVSARGTRGGAVLRAWEALERVGVQVVGVVLNRFQGSLADYSAGYARSPSVNATAAGVARSEA
jgi:capsular exopolysaccharide synthesis family protein